MLVRAPTQRAAADVGHSMTSPRPKGADIGLAWWRETGAASGQGSVHDLYETVDETLEVM